MEKLYSKNYIECDKDNHHPLKNSWTFSKNMLDGIPPAIIGDKHDLIYWMMFSFISFVYTETLQKRKSVFHFSFECAPLAPSLMNVHIPFYSEPTTGGGVQTPALSSLLFPHLRRRPCHIVLAAAECQKR